MVARICTCTTPPTTGWPVQLGLQSRRALAPLGSRVTTWRGFPPAIASVASASNCAWSRESMRLRALSLSITRSLLIASTGPRLRWQVAR